MAIMAGMKLIIPHRFQSILATLAPIASEDIKTTPLYMRLPHPSEPNTPRHDDASHTMQKPKPTTRPTAAPDSAAPKIAIMNGRLSM